MMRELCWIFQVLRRGFRVSYGLLLPQCSSFWDVVSDMGYGFNCGGIWLEIWLEINQ